MRGPGRGGSGTKRDWFRLFRDLMQAGVSMETVARRCNRNPSAVQHWANKGGEPKDSDARVILHLYAQYCPDKYREHAKEFEILVPSPYSTRPAQAVAEHFATA